MILKNYARIKEELYWKKEHALKDFRENNTIENLERLEKAINNYYSFIDSFNTLS